MYVTGCDRSWFDTPFLMHRFRVRSNDQIDTLKQSGVKGVVIDPSNGLDVQNGPEGAEALTVDRDQPAAGSSMAAEESETHGETVARQHDDAPPSSMDPASLVREFAFAREARRELIKQADRLFEPARSSKPIEGEHVYQLVRSVLTQELHRHATFLALIKMRAFDHTLCDHAVSVCTLSLMLGHDIGLPVESLPHLAAGALLHDVGLIQMPRRLVQQRHALASDEMERYNTHPWLGRRLLGQTDGVPAEVHDLVAYHHSRSGETSAGLHSGDFTTFLHIVQVADRYDELLTGQMNGLPLPPHQALSNLYQLATDGQLEVAVVSKMIRRIGVYPLYSLVKLSTGEHGLVTGIPPVRSHQPVITLLLNRQGQRYTRPVTIDFSADPAQPKTRSIVRILDVDTEGICVEELLSQGSPGK